MLTFEDSKRLYLGLVTIIRGSVKALLCWTSNNYIIVKLVFNLFRIDTVGAAEYNN